MLKAITFNPALDISGTVDKLIPDEKSYVRDEIHSPGGSGVNAAIIAHRLGVKVTAGGFIGGDNGKEIKQLLDELKLSHKFIPITGNTRMNFTINNSDNHHQTRLSFPGPQITKSEKKTLKKSLMKLNKNDIVVFGGSLPPQLDPSDVAKLVKLLSEKKIPCLVDMPGEILKEVIKSKPYFIKPNLMEFQNLAGKKVSTLKGILPLVRKMNEYVPLICVSSVEGGAILVSSESAWFGKVPKVKIRSTLGAGDSMVGAISARLLDNPQVSIEELLRWALAAACATLTEKGMVLGHKKNILYYLPKIQMRELK
jgi:1-phosphofructokinase family hexose kinase